MESHANLSFYFVVSSTLLISTLVKTSVMALSIALGAFLLPQLLTEIFQTGIINQLLHLFPIKMFNVKDLLEYLAMPQSFFTPNFFSNTSVLLIFLFMCTLVFTIINYLYTKKQQIN